MMQSARTFDLLFRISTCCMLVTGLGALAFAGIVSAGYGVAFVLAAVAGVRFRWNPGRMEEGLVFVLLLSIFLLDALLLSGFVKGAIHLMMLVSVARLSSSRGDRDYLLIFTIAFTFLLIASTVPASIAFLACLIAFLFFSVLSFILFESRDACREGMQTTAHLLGFTLASGVIAVLVSLIAVPIFVAIPRSQNSMWRYQNGLGMALTGFSDHVTLGDIGRILNNRQVFMRIRVDRPIQDVSSDLKWRGVALNHYDGVAWSSQPRRYERIRRGAVIRGFRLSGDADPDADRLRQTVVIDSPERVVFTAGEASQLHLEDSGARSQYIIRDLNGSLMSSGMRPRYFEYHVDSQLSDREFQLGSATQEALPREIRSLYLQLPELAPGVREMAARVVEGADSPVEKAARLESFLRSDFGYSLTNQAVSASDPLAHFLLVERAGHCEFFATALAVFLRIEGIPSRVVNGFRRGEFNQWNQTFTVRHSDAHSWVEAYFPQAGWVEFDATPAAAGGSGGWLSLTGQLWDGLDLFWQRLVSFDRLSQISFIVASMREARESVFAGAAMLSRIQGWGSALLEKPPSTALNLGALTLLALLATGVATALWGRPLLGRLGRRLRNSPGGSGRGYYREMEQILARVGLIRNGSETPLEFASRAERQMATSIPLRVTESYYRHQYGGQPPTDKEVGLLQGLLGELSRLSS